jgi:transcriptional regulator with XRE-family HTH domain
MNQPEQQPTSAASPLLDEPILQAVCIVAAALELALTGLLAPDAAGGGGLTRRTPVSPDRLLRALAAAPVRAETGAWDASRQSAPGFGELLRRHRRAVGFTQEELAERAGLSTRSISELERSGPPHVPRRDTVALLAEALTLSADDRAELDATVDRRRGPRPLPKSSVSAASRMRYLIGGADPRGQAGCGSIGG